MITAKKILVKNMVAKKSFLEDPSYSVLYRYIADSIFKLAKETGSGYNGIVMAKKK